AMKHLAVPYKFIDRHRVILAAGFTTGCFSNVTGMLHIGHILEHTEIDVVIRWRRIRGFLSLSLPATDHAGIATQMVVEHQTGSEGRSRQKLGEAVKLFMGCRSKQSSWSLSSEMIGEK